MPTMVGSFPGVGPHTAAPGGGEGASAPGRPQGSGASELTLGPRPKEEAGAWGGRARALHMM